ncbi:hypothetical protein ACFL1H_05020, partial [Nanoarchaeota archaeon]
KEMNPELINAIDKININLMADNFSGLNYNHHIINAIKYSIVKDKSVEEQIEMFDTILPYNNENFDKRKLLNDEIINLDIQNHNHRRTSYPVFHTKEKLEKILSLAKYTDKKRVEFITTTEIKDEFIRKGYNIREDHLSPYIDYLELPDEKELTYTEKIKDFMLHYLVGNAHKSIQEKFSRAKKEFNKIRATNLSIGINSLLGVSNLILSGISYSIVGENNPISNAHLYLGSGLLGLELIRTATISLADMKLWCSARGNLIGSLLSLPSLAVKVDKNVRNAYKTLYCKFDNEISSFDTPVKHNYTTVLNELAEIKVKDLEDNLDWNLDNHFSQSEYFLDKLTEKAELNGFGSKKYLNKKQGVFIYYDELESEDYTKLSALVCTKNNRYTLTCISNNKYELEDLSNIFLENNSQ